MSINITTNDEKVISVNSNLITKFSGLVKAALTKDKDTELTLNIPESHLKLAIEYMEHHDKKETCSPVPPLQVSWTVENAYEDKWDGTFLNKVIASENDPLLISFCRSVEYLDMDFLLKKATLAITIGIVRDHGLKSDKLAEEFNKIALSKKI